MLAEVASLREGKLVMAEAGRVADRELTLIQEDGTSKVVGEMPLVNASGNLSQRMLKFKSDFAAALLRTFDDRIIDQEVAKLLRSIYDF